MTQNQNVNPFAGAGETDTSIRDPKPAIGEYIATIREIRVHNGLTDTGVRFQYDTPNGLAGHRVSLKKDPRYAVNYGLRDTKVNVAAALGFQAEDPRAKALSEKDLHDACGPSQPLTGKRVRMVVTQGKADAKNPGQFHVNVRMYPVEDGQTVETKIAATAEIKLSGALPEPSGSGAGDSYRGAPPPPTEPEPVDVDGPWFDFPPTDKRHGVKVYNKAGKTKDKNKTE